ncbi:hydroxyisourate hydrolase [Pokkaliibacter sp. CJK22405]|uniref:hydroxyisourate hydrolase n=1 Tax=Pokkaliibacter sp. CJK22405 TaxID=3384615 RepID=UPI003984C06D
MITLSTHALDTLTGKPMEGLEVIMEYCHEGSWRVLSRGVTNTDGRIKEWPSVDALIPGRYRLIFALEPWCQEHNREVFFPEAILTADLDGSLSHYHLPLLFSGYGYTTYRGS